MTKRILIVHSLYDREYGSVSQELAATLRGLHHTTATQAATDELLSEPDGVVRVVRHRVVNGNEVPYEVTEFPWAGLRKDPTTAMGLAWQWVTLIPRFQRVVLGEMLLRSSSAGCVESALGCVGLLAVAWWWSLLAAYSGAAVALGATIVPMGAIQTGIASVLVITMAAVVEWCFSGYWCRHFLSFLFGLLTALGSMVLPFVGVIEIGPVFAMVVCYLALVAAAWPRHWPGDLGFLKLMAVTILPVLLVLSRTSWLYFELEVPDVEGYANPAFPVALEVWRAFEDLVDWNWRVGWLLMVAHAVLLFCAWALRKSETPDVFKGVWAGLICFAPPVAVHIAIYLALAGVASTYGDHHFVRADPGDGGGCELCQTEPKQDYYLVPHGVVFGDAEPEAPHSSKKTALLHNGQVSVLKGFPDSEYASILLGSTDFLWFLASVVVLGGGVLLAVVNNAPGMLSDVGWSFLPTSGVEARLIAGRRSGAMGVYLLLAASAGFMVYVRICGDFSDLLTECGYNVPTLLKWFKEASFGGNLPDVLVAAMHPVRNYFAVAGAALFGAGVVATLMRSRVLLTALNDVTTLLNDEGSESFNKRMTVLATNVDVVVAHSHAGMRVLAWDHKLPFKTVTLGLPYRDFYELLFPKLTDMACRAWSGKAENLFSETDYVGRDTQHIPDFRLKDVQGHAAYFRSKELAGHLSGTPRVEAWEPPEGPRTAPLRVGAGGMVVALSIGWLLLGGNEVFTLVSHFAVATDEEWQSGTWLHPQYHRARGEGWSPSVADPTLVVGLEWTIPSGERHRVLTWTHSRLIGGGGSTPTAMKEASHPEFPSQLQALMLGLGTTHTVVVVMGWNTDQEAAVANLRHVQEAIRAALQNEEGAPLYVLVTWPSGWGDGSLAQLFSYPVMAARADDVGCDQLTKLIEEISNAQDSTGVKRPVVLVGHSMGARALTTAVFNRRQQSPLSAVLVGLEPAFSANRFLDIGIQPGYRWPPPVPMVFTSSSRDHANPGARFASGSPHLGGEFGLRVARKHGKRFAVVKPENTRLSLDQVVVVDTTDGFPSHSVLDMDKNMLGQILSPAFPLDHGTCPQPTP